MPYVKQGTLNKLREAQAALEEAIKEDGKCSIAPEHKRAMRLYLQTWVQYPLDSAIAVIDGEDEESWEWSH